LLILPFDDLINPALITPYIPIQTDMYMTVYEDKIFISGIEGINIWHNNLPDSVDFMGGIKYTSHEQPGYVCVYDNFLFTQVYYPVNNNIMFSAYDIEKFSEQNCYYPYPLVGAATFYHISDGYLYTVCQLGGMFNNRCWIKKYNLSEMLNSTIAEVELDITQQEPIKFVVSNDNYVYIIVFDNEKCDEERTPYVLYIVNMQSQETAKIEGRICVSNNAEDIAFHEDYLYVADGSTGIVIFNLTDPEYAYRQNIIEPPLLPLSEDLRGLAGKRNGFFNNIEIQDDFAYVTIKGSYGIDNCNYLLVYSLEDPVNIRWIETVELNYKPEQLSVSGNYAYIKDTGSGIEIIELWKE
jgi:hypothetical protein